jgi:hypothetical protein
MPFGILMRRQHLDNTIFCVFPKCVILKRENNLHVPLLIRPHDLPTCPMELFTGKMKFLFFLIRLSYFVLLLVPCRHLTGFMPATFPKNPPPYPPFVLVAPPPPFHICFLYLCDMFILSRVLRHVTFFLLKIFIFRQE